MTGKCVNLDFLVNKVGLPKPFNQQNNFLSANSVNYKRSTDRVEQNVNILI